jgi:hypothetical protein
MYDIKSSLNIGLSLSLRRQTSFVQTRLKPPEYLFMNRQDTCSTIKYTLCGTGILPVTKADFVCVNAVSTLVYEQARCLFHNKIQALLIYGMKG